MFIKGKRYKKCGIVLLDISKESLVIPDLFLQENLKIKKLMNCIDDYNSKFGRNKLFFGAMGIKSDWKPQKAFISHLNPNDWNNLPIVKSF
jgi:hypothetical protein